MGCDATRPAIRLLAALGIVAFLASACGSDDPIDSEPSATATSTTTTEQSADPPTEPASVPTASDSDGPGSLVPEDWTPVTPPSTPPDPRIIEAGDGPHHDLRYGGDAVAPFALDIDHGNQGTRTMLQGTSTATADGLWIRIDTFDSDAPDLAELTVPFGVLVGSGGDLTLFGPAAQDWNDELIDTIGGMVATSFAPLPTEPVAVGTTWHREPTTPETAETAPVFQLLDVDGPLVAIAETGLLHGGVTTYDTGSGRAMGRIETDDGTIVIDSPQRGGFVAGSSVGLVLSSGSERGGRSLGEWRVEFTGTSLGANESSLAPGLTGAAAAVSTTEPVYVTSGSYRFDTPGDWSRSQFERTLEVVLDEILPGWAVNGSVIDQGGDFPDPVRIFEVGIGGTSVPVRWDLVEQNGSTITIRVDDTFSQDEVHRGDAFTVAGTASGEFTVDRFDPWDLTGELTLDFEIRDDDGVTTARQWWRSDQASVPDREGWVVTDFDMIEPVVTLVSQGSGPDPAVERRYGGGNWEGSIRIDQQWTRQWGAEDGAELQVEGALRSGWEADGQWVEFTTATATTDLFDSRIDEPAEMAPLALVAAPQEVDRFADEFGDDPGRRPTSFLALLADVLAVTTPPLPAEPIAPGASWTVAPSNQPDAITATFTLVETDGSVARIQVDAPADTYYGDRYDGWSIEADMTGTVDLDLATAVPMRADLVAEGTATFAVAGEPDQSTTEPWHQTLRVVAVEQTVVS